MSWYMDALRILVSSTKPTAEAKMEYLISEMLAIPRVQRAAKKNPRIVAAVLSAVFGEIPKASRDTITGLFAGYGIDILKALPRELVRAIEAEQEALYKNKKVSGGSILSKLPKKRSAVNNSSILSKLPRK